MCYHHGSDPPRPTISPFSIANPIPIHRQPLGQSSGTFPGFRHWSTSLCTSTMFKPSLSNMRYDNNTVLNAVMEILSRTSIPSYLKWVTQSTTIPMTTCLPKNEGYLQHFEGEVDAEVWYHEVSTSPHKLCPGRNIGIIHGIRWQHHQGQLR